MMREKKVKYFFANMFLMWAMSAYEYLLDSYTGEIQLRYLDLDKRYGKGYRKMDSLGLWLARDIHWYLKKPRTEDEREAKKILDRYVSLQPLFLQWAERLRTKAQQICQTVPVLNEAVVVYYFTCGWLLKILTESGRFIDSLNSSEVSERYHRGEKQLQNVTNHLRTELDMITKDITDSQTADIIRSEIENICNELAGEWREQLLASASQYLVDTK